jgi:ABC-type antimicrobial peptide transport system permease subunit
MGSVWLSLRADFRLRWRALAGLALLLGLIGGVTLTAAAGARRTDTAYPRLLRWASASQVDLVSGVSAAGFYQALRNFPQVASISVASYYDTVLPVRHGIPHAQVATYSSQDGSLGVSADRVKVLAGRLFGNADRNAAVIDQQLAAREHLRPGGTLHLLVVPVNLKGKTEPQQGVPMAFRVSAIVVFDNQIVPATQADEEPAALLSPPFTRTSAAQSSSYGTQVAVRLQPGASVAKFVQAATVLGHRYPAIGNAGGIDVVDLADQVAATERAIRPQAVALAVFAGLAGLVALIVIAQLLSRQLVLDSMGFPILRALGMTRRGLVALALVRLAAVTAAGGLLAVVIAMAASPVMPIGAARLAEPSPGVEVNFAILGIGFAAIAMLPLALVAPAAWRTAGRAPGPLGVAGSSRPARVSRLLGLAGSVTGGIGLRMAFEPGHGRTAVPVRSALLGTIVAVAAVVAGLVFGSSFVHLTGTPRLYGQDWQQELDLQFGAVSGPAGARMMAAQPGLAGYAAGNYGQVRVRGLVVPAISIDPRHGRNFLTLLSGRPPAGPGEVAFGAQTLRDINSSVGQTVTVLVNGRKHSMRIVGVAVFPAFGQGTIVATDLGSGAVVAASLLSVPFPPTHCTGNLTCYNFLLARYKQGTGMRTAAARLTATATALGCSPVTCSVTADQRPSDIRNFGIVRDTPLALGAILALLAVGTLTHVLLTGVRRRRRDLAVLKTLGMLRSQVLRVVSWQASALACAALLAGLPLGVVAGRWSWALFAGSLGVGGGADIPARLVLLTIPVTLLLANLLAAGPGWAAARIRPALILQTE